MPDKILITGATGRVSSAVIEALIEDSGIDLRALVRDESKARHLTAQGIEVVVGDTENPRSLEPALDGIQGVFMLAPLGPRSPEQNMNVLWAARQAGVRFAVRLSVIRAAYDAPTRNARLHSLSDHELMSSELQWTILRPHFFMQNLLAAAPTIAGQGVIYQNLGDGRLGMIDVRDIGMAVAAVLRSPASHAGRIYTLTGPESVSMDEAAVQIGGAIGRPLKYIAVSSQAARDGMMSAGMPSWIADALIEYGDAYASNWGDFVTSDFEALTGTAPRTLAEFARDSAAPFSGN